MQLTNFHIMRSKTTPDYHILRVWARHEDPEDAQAYVLTPEDMLDLARAVSAARHAASGVGSPDVPSSHGADR
jgi:hypothetical protein